MAKHQELRDRTKRFALRVIRMTSKLPKERAADVIARQALRSATAVAANYREASRARSDAELASKLGIVVQELDETLLWFELLVESGLLPAERMAELIDEADQLLSIVVTATRTTKARG